MCFGSKITIVRFWTPNETGISKLFPEIERNSRDVSLESGDSAIFPVNQLLEISISVRDVKFPRQEEESMKFIIIECELLEVFKTTLISTKSSLVQQ